MTPRRKTLANSGRAILYLRVSTDEQRESGLGLTAQAASCRQAADRAGLSIIATFADEGVSGSKPPEKRPGLSAALSTLKRGDVLLIARRDRLHRDVEIAVDCDRAIRRRRAVLMVADAPTTGDPASDLQRTRVDDFVAEQYLMRVKVATTAALRAKRASGQRAGTIPYGFKLRADGKTLAPNQKERRALRLILECREAGYSLRDTAAELNRKGLATRNGQPWRFEYVRSALRTIERHPEIDSTA